VGKVTREEALAIFAACVSDQEWPDGLPLPHNDTVFLPPSLLDQIAVNEIPAGVEIGVGLQRGGTVEIYWGGRIVRGEDGSFRAYVEDEISPEYWLGAVNARVYLDLVHKSVQTNLGRVQDLTIDDFDNDDGVMVRLAYSFPVDGADLAELFDRAADIQHDLELPADLVVDDVTKALAASSERILHGHYAEPAELVARVDAAETSADKGASLELLMEVLFAQVPGFIVWKRDLRTETEELDLFILNGSLDALLSREGQVVIVECKNWSGKAGRPEFSTLVGKMHNRRTRCSLAFFISWAGFAQTVTTESVRFSHDREMIVCLSGVEIRRAALAGSFPELLSEAIMRTLAM
jgi:hypothetical protein